MGLEAVAAGDAHQLEAAAVASYAAASSLHHRSMSATGRSSSWASSSGGTGSWATSTTASIARRNSRLGVGRRASASVIAHRQPS